MIGRHNPPESCEHQKHDMHLHIEKRHGAVNWKAFQLYKYIWKYVVCVCGLEDSLHSQRKLSDIWPNIGLQFCGSVIENFCGIVEFFYPFSPFYFCVSGPTNMSIEKKYLCVRLCANHYTGWPETRVSWQRTSCRKDVPISAIYAPECRLVNVFVIYSFARTFAASNSPRGA